MSPIGGHEEFRATAFSTYTPEVFVAKVCNSESVLPEHKIGNVPHLACASLDVLSEDSRVSSSERIGWAACKGRKYLLVLNGPSADDVFRQHALSPNVPTSKFLRDELLAAGIDPKQVAVTHACRFALPSNMRAYASQHKRENVPYLHADITYICPEVIITFGADSLKALFGADTKLDTLRGSVHEFVDHKGRGVPVVPSCSISAFSAGYADISVFRAELRRAKQIVDKQYAIDIGEVHYETITTVEGVLDLCERIRAAKPRHIAFDTEWGNDHAREEFNYTLSIQLAWAKGCAAFIVLRTQQEQTIEIIKKRGKKEIVERKQITKCGIPLHTPAEERKIWKAVQDLLLDNQWRLDGHHIRADADQFYRNNVPVDDRVADGFDTMLVHHCMYGDESQGLDHLTRKYLPEFGAYWQDLEEWFSENGRKSHIRHGYRDIPLDILIPYGLKDVDTTWRLAEILEKELDSKPRLRNLYWNHIAPTSLHIMDIERNGILVDEQRRMQMRDQYLPVYEDYLRQLRDKIKWPGFNPRSKHHIAHLLFSSTVYKDKQTGSKDCPADAVLLDLKPVCNTDKYPKLWEDIELAGEAEKHSPSTKANIMDIMTQQYPDVIELRILRYLSVIGKFLSTYLAPRELNEFGVPEDGAGFHNAIRSNGRVYTHLSQLTETGRYTSKKCNLQTSPKKQEDVLQEALVFHKFGITLKEYKKRTFDGKKGKPGYSGPDRIPPEDRLHFTGFKSCLVAPDNYVLVEADFKNAEVFIWAYLSGDQNLIDVVSTGRDLHCEVACGSFQLPPLADMESVIAQLKAGNRKPYDEWVDYVKANYGGERVAGKSVVFGN